MLPGSQPLNCWGQAAGSRFTPTCNTSHARGAAREPPSSSSDRLPIVNGRRILVIRVIRRPSRTHRLDGRHSAGHDTHVYMYTQVREYARSRPWHRLARRGCDSRSKLNNKPTPCPKFSMGGVDAPTTKLHVSGVCLRNETISTFRLWRNYKYLCLCDQLCATSPCVRVLAVAYVVFGRAPGRGTGKVAGLISRIACVSC